MRSKQIVVPARVNEVWGLDFVPDQLADGTRFRALTIVDVFSREALAIAVGKRLGAENVVASLNRLVAQRQAPRYLFVDNGSALGGCWTCGRIITSTSAGQASRPTTASWRPSTVRYATSA